jgi:hypothetical protein
LFSWRITKYNPKNRDEKGYYLDEKEWTCFSEIGTKVSKEDYLRTESNYINAITTFMDVLGIKKLYLNALEIWSDEVNTQNVSPFLSKMWVGKPISTQEIKELAKLTLRNVIWCKLSYKNKFFVHFGNDYYMYIGTNMDSSKSLSKNRRYWIIHRGNLFPLFR